MFFAVTAKCGHTGFGKGYYIPIIFAVAASSAKDAAAEARWLPRVKHDHKDAIISVREITKDEFDKIICRNRLDPFLNVSSIQEQRTTISYDELISRVRKEPELVPERTNQVIGNHWLYQGKTKLIKPKQYMKYLDRDRLQLSRVDL